MNTLTRIWLRRYRANRTFRPPAAKVARRSRAARSLTVGFVTLVVLQLGLGVAAEQSLRFRDPVYGDREALLRKAEAARPGGPRVVMIGTSRTAFAFHATRVEDQLQGEFPNAVAFNLGIPASGPISHLIYLRRLLERGHRPDLLLVEVLPPMLADLPDGPLEARFLTADKLRRREVEAVAGYVPNGDDLRSRWRSTVLVPWSALRFQIVSRMSPSALPWHLRFDWGRNVDPRGWGTPEAECVTPEQYRKSFASASAEYRDILATFNPGGGAVRALADIVTLCRERSIPLRLVLMPETEDFRALYPPAAREKLAAVLRDADAGCIDAREWVPTNGFTDGHHLLRGGAATFSDRLTREVIAPGLRAK